MKLEHEYYDLQDLEKRWSEYGYTEKDILKYGVSGKLQFSIIVPNRPNTTILISRVAQLSGGELVTCNETFAGGPGCIYTISSFTVKDILLAESDYTKNGIHSEVNLQLEIPCTEPKCKYPNLANCNLEYSIVPLAGPSDRTYTGVTCNRFDLIVTHTNVLAFEETYLKADAEEPTPPYLDPDNEFYSVTLDLAVQAWKAIFKDKKHCDKASAALAAAAYLESQESGCAELLEKYNMELTPTFASQIAKIAAGEYSPNKVKWNEYRNRNK
jgi:hypothetical protein